MCSNLFYNIKIVQYTRPVTLYDIILVEAASIEKEYSIFQSYTKEWGEENSYLYTWW